MPESNGERHILRFGVFEVDVQGRELRKHGLRIKLPNQPFQVLATLLESRGEVVTREELYKELWPDEAFLDFERNLNAVVKKLRLALADSAESPRFIDTVARRGYRFIAPVVEVKSAVELGANVPANGSIAVPAVSGKPRSRIMRRLLWTAALLMAVFLLTSLTAVIYSRRTPPPGRPQRSLARLGSASGSQLGVTWSPDGRLIAFSSNRAGKFDIWVQQAAGTEPLKITSLAGHNWQPDWSPDGERIVFRAEGEDGGLYVIPALGGAAKRISSFGYHPRWSPDGREILFAGTMSKNFWNKLYLVGMDGQPPRPILSEFFENSGLTWRAAAWHPGGDRISIWGSRPGGCSFWTVPIAGGRAIESDVSFNFAQTARGLDLTCLSQDGDFVWAPSGRAIFFAARSRGVQNIWRITVDSTLAWKSLDRITTGPGPDSHLAISRDGKQLAFLARAEQTRIWSFPFDAISGRLNERGQPVTASGADATGPDISPDGTRLVFMREHGGNHELWEEALPEQRPLVLADDGLPRFEPRWSPDGQRVLYSSTHLDCRSLPAAGGTEQILSSDGFCSDWSPDGQWVIASQSGPSGESIMRFLPVSNSAAKAKLVTSSRQDNFFQMRVSPDAKWVVFEAVGSKAAVNPRLYVVPAGGGKWIAITDGKAWDDKPRWSPDGKNIYFLSAREGFMNVWGIRFDPAKGTSAGDPFRVTSFDDPALMIGKAESLQLSVAKNRLVLPMTQSSGSTWVIENPEL